MTSPEKRKGGGAKTARSETVTVRVSPELRHLAEIAARIQRRTLSSYFEWAIEDSLNHVSIYKGEDGKSLSIATVNAEKSFWHDNINFRFLILASRFPEFLTHDEKRLWEMFNSVSDVLRPTKDVHGAKIGFRVDMVDAQMFDMNRALFDKAITLNMSAEEVAKMVVMPDEYDHAVQLLAAKLRTIRDFDELKKIDQRIDKLVKKS